jgi:hypothetical protein
VCLSFLTSHTRSSSHEKILIYTTRTQASLRLPLLLHPLLDIATAAAAAALTSTGLRSSVLGGYRRLMRLRLQVFVGDQYAIDQARLQLRAESLKHRVCTWVRGLGRAREEGREGRMWNVDLAGRLPFSLCSACALARIPASLSCFTRLTSSPSPPSLPSSLPSTARAEPRRTQWPDRGHPRSRRNVQ